MRVAITGFGANCGHGAHILTPQTPAQALVRAPHALSPAIGLPATEKVPLAFISAVRSQLVQAELMARRRTAWRINPDRVGVVYGSSKGDLEHLENSRVWAEWSPAWAQDWVAWPDHFVLQMARSLGVFGPVMAPVAACATGTHAVALGAGWIQSGRADVVIAGAMEPPQPEIILAAYRNMNALSKTGLMRPFDTRRDGFVAGNGDGFLLLESESHARKRGAPIHGFLTGYSLKCDATHMTSMHPSGEFIARAIEDALQKAGHPQIDYINAHGTGTSNDIIEARAIEQVFGTRVPVSSTKPLTGHLLGASGAVEAAICLLAMRDNFAPPTLNLENVDSASNLDFLPLQGREMEIGAVLSLNYGFGGHIGALVFEKN